MKRTGRHRQNVLTAVEVRKKDKPGRYLDGNGLYLVVDPSGARRWVLRTIVQGRRRDIGLGGVPVVTLAKARELALEMRGQARAGKDPVLERKLARRQPPLFKEAAQTVYDAEKEKFRNEKHSAQWIGSLETYAYPFIGDLPIDKIRTPQIVDLLKEIWLSKRETARRVRQRISTVFEWAIANEHFQGSNPVSAATAGLPKQPVRIKHHAAITPAKLPNFVTTLRDEAAATPARLALEVLILTATRTGEVLQAKWNEFDLEEGVWTIPADRMKAGRVHRVPLAPQVIELLRSLPKGRGDDYAFPGNKTNEPLSNTALRRLLLDRGERFTIHGFRSTFRDWAAERTKFSAEVAEAALAHTIKNKTEAAYRRGDLLEKRKALMVAWANFVRPMIAKSQGSKGDRVGVNPIR